MTISNTNSFVVLQGNGVTTDFPFSFLIPSDTIRVSLTNAAGVETVLLSGQYSVTGLNNPVGGVVTISPAPASGIRVLILREVPYTQTISIDNQQRFYASVVMTGLNRVVMQIQQLLNRVNRVPQVRPQDSVGFDFTLPQPQGGYAFGWAEDESGFINIDFATPLAQARQARDDAQTAQAAAETAEENAETAETNAAASASTAVAARDTTLGYRNTTLTYRNEAQAARDLARFWATQDEDVPVASGEFSARHWAIKAQQAATVDATIYVAKDGDNTADGRAIARPVETIERAIVIAKALNLPQGLITVGPGIYDTAGELDPPPGWAVQCVHRTTALRATSGNESKLAFHLSGGNFIEGFTGIGWEIDDLNNPTGGFLTGFKPGAFIDRLPYVHKCVMFRPQPKSLIGAALDRANGNPDVGNGGGVILADGAVPHPLSPFKQIMAWGATPSSPNGIGYCAKNGGFINAVNAVALWAHKHFLALSGGQILLSSCSTQFGDWTLFADGYGQSLNPASTAGPLTVETSAADAVDAARTAIIDAMWSSLVSGGFTTGWTAADETFTRRDAGIFLDAVVTCFRQGDQRPMDVFARGLFKTQATSDYWIAEQVPVFSGDKLAAFVASFNFMRDSIQALAGVGAAADTMIGGIVAALNATLNAPQFRREQSLITAIGHQWTQPLAGVTRAALPPRFGGAGKSSSITRSVRQRRGGKVIMSGQDDEGNAVFVGGLNINARTGQLGGAPFDTAVEVRAIEAAIAMGN